MYSINFSGSYSYSYGTFDKEQFCGDYPDHWLCFDDGGDDDDDGGGGGFGAVPPADGDTGRAGLDRSGGGFAGPVGRSGPMFNPGGPIYNDDGGGGGGGDADPPAYGDTGRAGLDRTTGGGFVPMTGPQFNPGGPIYNDDGPIQGPVYNPLYGGPGGGGFFPPFGAGNSAYDESEMPASSSLYNGVSSSNAGMCLRL